MTKAFTLIEVLIAVAIVFTAGLGLLSVSSNNSKIINYAKSKTQANMFFSLAVLNNLCGADKETNLYDAVKTKFMIKDDSLISALKEQNLTCESEEVFNMKLSDSKEIEESLDKIPQMTFIINKIAANINGANIIGYEIKAEM
ncbi:MAG: prepilin-type N-terminal cleavage/methylation domain-containing protein [Campylobacteraceae bacterium]|jgi:competence protein ComGC|nr:prepilin-type N-terminal cleavage/methylation domain-containing protein [Campylobacteraceae bacterium]